MQTGWRISCWNADEFTIYPSDDVLLSMGRRDAMCREYQFYNDPDERGSFVAPILKGRMVEETKVSFLMDKSLGSLSFMFNIDYELVKDNVRLRLHTADRSKDGAVVKFMINETCVEHQLPNGYGIQNRDPAHLASPSTLEFVLPITALRNGDNVLIISICDAGWFTWDALDLIAVIL